LYISTWRLSGQILATQNQQTAEDFARRLAPVVDALQAEGYTTVSALRDVLNTRAISTFHPGRTWHIQTVSTLLQRIARLRSRA